MAQGSSKSLLTVLRVALDLSSIHALEKPILQALICSVKD